ncbi:inositol monophosphatase family protein [Niabella beijingensis]|uniref:inositol monophosphatase family protein n=1 Tax=Niabella beijingensis TaxID=2872700 RepID=UPI001CBFDFA9|nr:inositol monophosphatase family protein [Niabella beijingensis]MBZ4189218.1 inositol monophosphatase [Niabella beijingensis]
MLATVLEAAVRAGAAELTRYFQQSFSIQHKEGRNNLVTDADHASERAIIEVIRSHYPDHFILTEESGELVQESDYKWIIDPLDGTINFAHGIPINCVSVGVEYKKEIILGMVYNPHMNELFFAEKGKGATLNGLPLKVSEETEAMRSCLVTGFPYVYINMENGPLQVFERFIKEGVPVRRLGAAAIDLCWVAAGRFDGFYEHKLEAWDSAAGYLIVEEAGGKVTDFNGGKFSPYQHRILATNGRIHDELLAIINNVAAANG